MIIKILNGWQWSILLQNFNFEILDLGLVYYKNVIKNPKELIDKIETLDSRISLGENKETKVKPWVKWTYGDGEDKLMFCWQKFIPQVKDIKEEDPYFKEQMEISSELFGALESTLSHYSNQIYPFAAKNIKSRESTMHILRYDESGHLPPHQDQGVSSRVLSVLLYLNDDYEGGEIEFRHSNVKFKPDAGSILFFPSNFLYVHEVHPVTKGPRYALPNWYHNIKDEGFRLSTGEE
jgi:Rps23 Pro-64 3,4-dihydroxylase Tpa1-like proline 4-hydroxylase